MAVALLAPRFKALDLHDCPVALFLHLISAMIIVPCGYWPPQRRPCIFLRYTDGYDVLFTYHRGCCRQSHGPWAHIHRCPDSFSWVIFNSQIAAKDDSGDSRPVSRGIKVGSLCPNRHPDIHKFHSTNYTHTLKDGSYRFYPPPGLDFRRIGYLHAIEEDCWWCQGRYCHHLSSGYEIGYSHYRIPGYWRIAWKCSGMWCLPVHCRPFLNKFHKP